jgi:hypothetical protein
MPDTGSKLTSNVCGDSALRGRIAYDGENFVDTLVILLAHWIDRVEWFRKEQEPQAFAKVHFRGDRVGQFARLPPFHERAVLGIFQVTALEVDDRTHVQAQQVTEIGRLWTAAAVEGAVDL